MEGGEEDDKDNEDNGDNGDNEDLPARQQYVLLLKGQYQVSESLQPHEDYFDSISLLQVEQLNQENHEKSNRREYSVWNSFFADLARTYIRQCLLAKNWKDIIFEDRLNQFHKELIALFLLDENHWSDDKVYKNDYSPDYDEDALEELLQATAESDSNSRINKIVTEVMSEDWSNFGLLREHFVLTNWTLPDINALTISTEDVWSNSWEYVVRSIDLPLIHLPFRPEDKITDGEDKMTDGIKIIEDERTKRVIEKYVKSYFMVHGETVHRNFSEYISKISTSPDLYKRLKEDHIWS
jgi:hypothetical protein